jgi:hypothetical protein
MRTICFAALVAWALLLSFYPKQIENVLTRTVMVHGILLMATTRSSNLVNTCELVCQKREGDKHKHAETV